jgi:putative intracellular protease/amidase
MSDQKVLFVLTSHDTLGSSGKETGYYLPEVTHPYEAFEQAGIEVEFVSSKGGKAPMIGVDLEDPLNKAFLDDPLKMAKVENTIAPTEVEPSRYAAIFYAGGHGTMWDFPDDERLSQIAAKIYEQGGVVGAVCHGPAGLINIKLSDGFTNEEEAAVGLSDVVPFLLEATLIDRGAKYTKAPNFQPHVEVSDRLVTGQNPASAKGVGEKMVELLKRLDPVSADRNI